MTPAIPYEIQFGEKVYRVSDSTPPLDPNKTFVRVLHDYEIWVKQIVVEGHSQYYHTSGWTWRLDLPEVYWLYGGVSTPLNENAQNLILEMNPYSTSKKLTVALDYFRAYTNRFGQGFDTRTGIEPHEKVRLANYFLKEDLNYPLPSYDKIRVTGGQTLYGYFDAEKKWFYPDHLKPNDIPSWNVLEAKFWLYFTALSTGMNKATKEPTFVDFNQGNGYPLRLPFISSTVVRVPANTIQVVDGWTDPYQVYIFE